jgi:hypothetical protein
MIVNKQTHPERDLYYLGAQCIERMQSSGTKEFDYFELYQDMYKQYKISLNLFALTLDWLFILGAIKKEKQGKISKCF